jgi:hypothetical protein
MKIRTDFVTNSSTQNYAEIVIDNSLLLEILQRYKEMGLFADNDPFFGIGNRKLCDYTSGQGIVEHGGIFQGTKTPAFYYYSGSDEEVHDGLSFDCPETLDNVLSKIITLMDIGKEYMDPWLYSQLKDDLHKNAEDINHGYLNISWWQKSSYNISGDEEEYHFNYDPENGVRYEGKKSWEEDFEEYETDNAENDENASDGGEERNDENSTFDNEAGEQSKEVEESSSVTETLASSEVMSFEEVIEHWLEYDMQLPIVHEHAVNLVPACIKAINEVNAYRMDTLIDLPIGVSITWGSTSETTNLCPAYAIVYRFQLTDWLKEDWDIEKHRTEKETERQEPEGNN